MSDSTMRRVFALIAIALAAIAAVLGWIGLGAVEIGANDSLDAATASLLSVEVTLRGSTDVAAATAEALDAAAASLDSASATSTSTAAVAADVADVMSTLPELLTAVSDSLGQIDGSIDDINSVLRLLNLRRIQGIDSNFINIDILLLDLADAEVSLDELSRQAALFGPGTDALAAQVRAVAAELRSSIDDVNGLADEVGATRGSLSSGDQGEPVNVLIGQLAVAGLALAVIVGQLPNIVRALPSRAMPDQP